MKRAMKPFSTASWPAQVGTDMRHQRGVAIITAIFILVTLALLAAAAAKFASFGHISSVQDYRSAVALNAARSGLEWAAYQKRAGLCAAGVCSFDFSFPAAASSFSGINVHVVIDNGGGNGVARITSTACNESSCPNTTNPGPLYVERQVEMLF